jgi:hypothetical protein
VLAAVGQCLDRKSAESLLRLRADAEMQARIEELADKCTEGTLSEEERQEYDSMMGVGNFVAILQAKARRLLADGHAVLIDQRLRLYLRLPGDYLPDRLRIFFKASRACASV